MKPPGVCCLAAARAPWCVLVAVAALLAPDGVAAHCKWSGMVIAPFVPLTNLVLINHNLLAGCDDPRLDAERRGHCLMCERQTTRETCLKKQAQHWNNYLDMESCAWEFADQQNQTVYELNFTLRVNMPFMFNAKVHKKGKDDVCSVRHEYTIYGEGYSTAYFVIYGDGELPNGDPMPAA